MSSVYIMSLLCTVMTTPGLSLERRMCHTFVPSSCPTTSVSQAEHHAFVDLDFCASTTAKQATWLKWVFFGHFSLSLLFLLYAPAYCPIMNDMNERTVAVVWLKNPINLDNCTDSHKSSTLQVLSGLKCSMHESEELAKVE